MKSPASSFGRNGLRFPSWKPAGSLSSKLGLWALITYGPNLCAQQPLTVESTAATPSSELTGPAWLEPYDPTLLNRRIVTEFEYQDLRHGGSSANLQWSLRYSILLDTDYALGLVAVIPWAWADSDGHRESGLGDLELRTLLVHRFAPDWRWAVGVSAKIPTTADESLGDGAYEVRSIAAVRWDVTPRVNLGLNAEYNYTPRDVDGADVSALELKLPLTFEFSKMWSVFTSYNPRWNFANQDTLRQRLELGLTRVLGSHDQFALSVGVELPLARAKDSISWKTTLGVTWLFN